MPKRDRAYNVLNELHSANRITADEYNILWDGLEEFETLEQQDAELEKLWADLEDVPMNPDTERTEAAFMDFPAGTDREDIWHWFDERHSKGIAYLLYADGIDRTPELARLAYLKQLCFKCDDPEGCLYRKDGECRFALVEGRAPVIDDSYICEDYKD